MVNLLESMGWRLRILTILIQLLRKFQSPREVLRTVGTGISLAVICG
jgi:hypothetical protein